MRDDDGLATQLIELEIKFAHQERTVQALDEVVREFARRVEILERQVGELRDASSAPPAIGPGDEKPPHY